MAQIISTSVQEEGMKQQDLKPFTLLFEESGVEDEFPHVPIEYSPKEGLSFVYIDNQRKPFVEWSLDYFGTKTGDHTKQIRDPTDTDPGDG